MKVSIYRSTLLSWNPLLIVESNLSAACDRSKHLFLHLVVKYIAGLLSCRSISMSLGTTVIVSGQNFVKMMQRVKLEFTI